MKNENSTRIDCVVKLTKTFFLKKNKRKKRYDEVFFIIYKITNTLKGENDRQRFYVGQHIQYNKNPYEFDGYLGSGEVIVNSVKNYGKDNFKRETLEVCNSLKEMNEREIFWIKELKANFKDYPENDGMNLTNGGEGRLGYSFTDEQRENVRKRMMSEKNHFYGQHHTKEVKEYLSKLFKGIKRPDLSGENHIDVTGENNPKNKYRYIMSNNEIFWTFFDKNERAILIKKFSTYKTNIITHKNITIQRFRKDEF